MVRFQVGGLKAEHRVRYAVGLGETVLSEFGDLGKQMLCGRLLDALFLCALDEVLLVRFHLAWYFFAHRATQKVRTFHIVASQNARNLKNLLLVNDDAVGLF